MLAIAINKAKLNRREQLSRLTRLLSSQETALQRAFGKAVKEIKGAINIKEIADLVKDGNLTGALDKLDDTVPGLFTRHFVDERTRMFQRAGISQAKELAEKTPLVQARFDVTNEHAVDSIRNNELRLVSNFSDTQRVTTHQALARGIEEGANPRAIARDFRDSIGLTPIQEQAVANYRRGLIEKAPEALQRKLRDRRFDGTVRRAFRSGTGLDGEMIDKLTDRYRERYVKYRSEVIGRTEALRSANEGTHEMWEQAIESGQVEQRLVRRYWNTANDGRVRNAHSLIPGMNAQGRGITEPFQTVLGPLLHPGDANGLPANTIQCRCVITTEIITEEEADSLSSADEAFAAELAGPTGDGGALLAPLPRIQAKRIVQGIRAGNPVLLADGRFARYLPRDIAPDGAGYYFDAGGALSRVNRQELALLIRDRGLGDGTVPAKPVPKPKPTPAPEPEPTPPRPVPDGDGLESLAASVDETHLIETLRVAYKDMDETLENALIARWRANRPKVVKSKRKGAVYKPQLKTIDMDGLNPNRSANPDDFAMRALAHEFGHFVDDSGGSANLWGSARKYQEMESDLDKWDLKSKLDPSNDDKFAARYAEFKRKIKGSSWQEKWKSADDLFDIQGGLKLSELDTDYLSVVARSDNPEEYIFNLGIALEKRRVKDILRYIDPQKPDGIIFDDYFGALSKNRAGQGHTNAYYRKYNDLRGKDGAKSKYGLTAGNAVEAFANYVALSRRSPTALSIMRAVSPRTVKAFEDRLDVIGAEVRDARRIGAKTRAAQVKPKPTPDAKPKPTPDAKREEVTGEGTLHWLLTERTKRRDLYEIINTAYGGLDDTLSRVLFYRFTKGEFEMRNTPGKPNSSYRNRREPVIDMDGHKLSKKTPQKSKGMGTLAHEIGHYIDDADNVGRSRGYTSTRKVAELEDDVGTWHRIDEAKRSRNMKWSKSDPDPKIDEAFAERRNSFIEATKGMDIDEALVRANSFFKIEGDFDFDFAKIAEHLSYISDRDAVIKKLFSLGVSLERRDVAGYIREMPWNRPDREFFSDYFSAMSNRRVGDREHSAEYYQQFASLGGELGLTSGNTTEAFANYVALSRRGTANLEVMKIMTPRTVRAFEGELENLAGKKPGTGILSSSQPDLESPLEPTSMLRTQAKKIVEGLKDGEPVTLFDGRQARYLGSDGPQGAGYYFDSAGTVNRVNRTELVLLIRDRGLGDGAPASKPKPDPKPTPEPKPAPKPTPPVKPVSSAGELIKVMRERGPDLKVWAGNYRIHLSKSGEVSVYRRKLDGDIVPATGPITRRIVGDDIEAFLAKELTAEEISTLLVRPVKTKGLRDVTGDAAPPPKLPDAETDRITGKGVFPDAVDDVFEARRNMIEYFDDIGDELEDGVDDLITAKTIDEHLTSGHGRTFDSLKQADKLVEGMFDDISVFKRINGDHLEKIFAGDRLRNAHDSDIDLYVAISEHRDLIEDYFFNVKFAGIDTPEEADFYPHYAFLSNGKMPGKSAFSAAQDYGDTTIRFKKKNVVDRSTSTLGDSLLQNTASKMAVPVRLNKPPTREYLTSMRGLEYDEFDEALKAKNLDELSDSLGYAEAQIYGRVTADDIEAVIVDSKDEVTHWNRILKARGYSKVKVVVRTEE